jgi:hypothetical protein
MGGVPERERRMRERWFLDSESPKRAPCAKLNWGSKSWRRQASGFLSRAPSSVGVKGAPRRGDKLRSLQRPFHPDLQFL